MSKFRKKEKETPEISTASLPDIVFMLLFFFMVTTVMRETDVIVRQELPQAAQLKKLENPEMVSYVYVGPPKDARKYGKEARIQINDVLNLPASIVQFVELERTKLKESQRKQFTVSLKVDRDAKMGLLTDVKFQLREADARKVNYASNKKLED